MSPFSIFVIRAICALLAGTWMASIAFACTGNFGVALMLALPTSALGGFAGLSVTFKDFNQRDAS